MASEKRSNSGGEKTLNVRELTADKDTVRRTFPGPRNANAKLRVAMERGAYAELIAHAKTSLEAEVCGVLAGHVCEDDEGLFVSVEASIRGAAATEKSARVTFTQETWNVIHKTLERDYPKLKIVGWYHTHPGFGVEFSDMDMFIQRNFFSAPAHLALVTDPLSGAVAICFNAADGIQYLERFWVDGREQPCRIPSRKSDEIPQTSASGGDSDRLRVLEDRVGQLVQALDETRTFHHRFMLTCGFMFCLALIAVAGYTIYNEWTAKLEPPKVNQIVPVPVQIGDKSVILGVGITSWEIPPELDSIMLQAEIAREQAQAKAATNAAASPSTNAP